jgi:hypothetical protein
MTLTWLDYLSVGALIAALFGFIGILCRIIWSSLNRKIEDISVGLSKINDDPLFRIRLLAERVGKHDSDMHANASSIQAIEFIMSERKDDHERRFSDIGQSLLRIEVKIGDLMKEVLLLLAKSKT